MTPFPLQTVLDVRKRQEERSLMEFVEEARCLKEEKERLGGMQRQVNDALGLLRNLQQKTIEVMEMEMHLVHVRNCRRLVQEQRAVVDRREGEVRARRERLVQAMKERKVMETLRDRHHAEQKKEEDTREQAAMDERATMGARRKRT
ncbi:MAG: flagellar export protein FliJ [Syntrophaceae bacterium]|nr:flagellar export protein FliJ [Syntrophaceae bacterium]